MAGTVGEVQTQFFTYGSEADPFVLFDGGSLPSVTLAYETYGKLNQDASNAILVFHALTGSHHAAGFNAAVPGIDGRWTEEQHQGWWEGFIGPGKPFDTNKYFVICANYIGGCYGSTGPTSVNPRTSQPYGASFPNLRFCDIVDSQLPLVKHLGIEKLHAVAGGSTGGMMALSLATRYPDVVDVVLPIATGVRTTTLQRIHNFEQINAIQTDDDFQAGSYDSSKPPTRGLALARMISHKTFVSLKHLKLRARHEVIDVDDGPGYYRLTDALESYMRHQGGKFIKRFDANSYLRLMRAWQSVDLAEEAGCDGPASLFTGSRYQRFLTFSIDSDVCFYPVEQEEMVGYLAQCDVPHHWVTVHSDKGHDSFLLEPELYGPHIAVTLDR